MRQSQFPIKTQKEAPKDELSINAKLLIRAGFINKLAAGIYSFLPLGLRVLRQIENIVRREMVAIGGLELLMPALQPKDNWQQTGRWESFDALFRLQGVDKKDYALGATHEEIISPLTKNLVLSYKDLPLYLFQIQTKFRNEPRAKSGLLRTREFSMKDLYSFHANQNDLDQYYKKVESAYFKIFAKCGLGEKTFLTLASGGSFSKYSHEFQTITEGGEDTIYICQKCKLAINEEIFPLDYSNNKPQNSSQTERNNSINNQNNRLPNKTDIGTKRKNPTCPACGSSDFKKAKAVEVGNIFKLGTKYSAPFDLKFRDADGKEKIVIMGCYGLGPSRLMGAIVEVWHDEKGIIWPKEVAPFVAHLITVNSQRSAINNQIEKTAKTLEAKLEKQGVEILYDDRQDVSLGVKFADADLIGIPTRIVISEKTLEKGAAEIKKRNEKKAELIAINNLYKFFA